MNLLSRYVIKHITATQIKEIAEICRAAIIATPEKENLWNVIVYLKVEEFTKIKNLGYTMQKLAS